MSPIAPAVWAVGGGAIDLGSSSSCIYASSKDFMNVVLVCQFREENHEPLRFGVPDFTEKSNRE